MCEYNIYECFYMLYENKIYQKELNDNFMKVFLCEDLREKIFNIKKKIKQEEFNNRYIHLYNKNYHYKLYKKKDFNCEIDNIRIYCEGLLNNKDKSRKTDWYKKTKKYFGIEGEKRLNHFDNLSLLIGELFDYDKMNELGEYGGDGNSGDNLFGFCWYKRNKNDFTKRHFTHSREKVMKKILEITEPKY